MITQIELPLDETLASGPENITGNIQTAEKVRVPGHPECWYAPAYPRPIHRTLYAAIHADDPYTALRDALAGMDRDEALEACESMGVPLIQGAPPGKPAWGALVVVQGEIEGAIA